MAGEVRAVSGRQLESYADGIRTVYTDAFGGPPWAEGPTPGDAYLSRLADDARRPGFRAALALHEGTVLGFATAWTTPAPEGMERPSSSAPTTPPKYLPPFSTEPTPPKPRPQDRAARSLRLGQDDVRPGAGRAHHAVTGEYGSTVGHRYDKTATMEPGGR